MSQSDSFAPVDVPAAQRMSASEAIQYHYDNDTRFFSLWLDPTLSYSAARWHRAPGALPNVDSLSEAQAQKIRFHLDWVALPPGGRLIDVGCGWGAVLRAAVGEHGAGEAVGLTLSQDQLDYIEETRVPGVSAKLEDVFAYASPRPFDGAVSIGAFEHFAKPAMDRQQKLAVYEAFFERMHALLAPRARLSLQTIVWDRLSFDEAKRWIPQTVFPQSDLPFIAELAAASAGPFRMIYLENEPRDYTLTLEAWLSNLREHRDVVIAEWGEAKYDFFEHYLRNSRLAFTRRKTSLARVVLVRR